MTINTQFVEAWCRQELLSKASKTHYSSTRLTCHSYDSGSVLPYKKLDNDDFGCGVISSEGTYVEATGLHVGKGHSYPYKHCEQSNDIVVYIGFMFGVWGHCFTDNLKHLWFLHTNEYILLKQKYPSIRLVYTCQDNFCFSTNFIELLKLMDIDCNEFVRIERVTQFKRVYVPETCFITTNEGVRLYTQEYKSLIKRASDKILPNFQYNKIYLTRTKLRNGARDNGEKHIEKAFKSNGFKIISPEKLSIQEQIALYKGCKIIATTEGSIAHNSAFMQEGMYFVILRKADYVNEYQFPINEMNNLKVTYIDAHLSVFVDIEHPSVGPFFLYVNDNLNHYLGNVKQTFSLKAFKKYNTLCLLLPHIERRVTAKREFYEKLSSEIELKKNKYRDYLKNMIFLPNGMKKKLINVAKFIVKL